jgi:hypothetical protein
LFAATGCLEGGAREFFVVDFEPEAALKYKLVSERQIEVDFNSSPSKASSGKTQKVQEKLELVIDYKPVEPDPYGLTTIEAVCRSAKVTRSSGGGKDAVEALAGKTFTFQLSPTGKIADHSNLYKLVRQLGDNAFSAGDKRRIKDPDMIFDFVALQWYLWDSIAAIEKPLDGVATGQSWKTEQLIPLPVPYPSQREITYTLAETVKSETGRKAIINSSYALTDSPLGEWPRPYSNYRFQLKGTFGFLRNYRFFSLEGTGKQIFNIDRGVVENEQQHYVLKANVDFLMPLADTQPQITIDQKMTVELLE